MIKIGDMVEVVECGVYHTTGGKFTVAGITDECCLDEEGSAIMRHKVRLFYPLKTEAEKRAAKFGVGGVIKATGEKWVFAQDIGLMWRGIAENGNVYTGEPHQFRLDHEPEYREIPFCEATHEQRMVVKNLRLKIDEEILGIQISHCEGFYSITLGDGTVVLFYENGTPILFRKDSHEVDFRLTVRVPT